MTKHVVIVLNAARVVARRSRAMTAARAFALRAEWAIEIGARERVCGVRSEFSVSIVPEARAARLYEVQS